MYVYIYICISCHIISIPRTATGAARYTQYHLYVYRFIIINIMNIATSLSLSIYIYIYIFIIINIMNLHEKFTRLAETLRSISEISSCFFGPSPWHIEIRHRVKKASTINLFGFETLKLKIRRLKLWKPTIHEKFTRLAETLGWLKIA